MIEKKFEHVKVGDTVMIREWVGLGYRGNWSKTYFGVDFYIAHKVTKVLKTQFRVDELRFNKDGSGYGENSYDAYRPGEMKNGFGNPTKIPTSCQNSEMLKYEKKIKPLKKYSVNISRGEISPLRAKTVDDALEADKLMTKAKWIIDGKQ